MRVRIELHGRGLQQRGFHLTAELAATGAEATGAAAAAEGEDEGEAEEGAAEADFDERQRPPKAPLVEHAAAVGAMPESGVVTAEQAESALSRTMATELDQNMLDTLDADTKEEEDALAGRQVNPPEAEYSCICWQPHAPDSVSALTVGWDAGRAAQSLNRADFACTSAAAMCHSFRVDLRQSRRSPGLLQGPLAPQALPVLRRPLVLQTLVLSAQGRR